MGEVPLYGWFGAVASWRAYRLQKEILLISQREFIDAKTIDTKTTQQDPLWGGWGNQDLEFQHAQLLNKTHTKVKTDEHRRLRRKGSHVPAGPISSATIQRGFIRGDSVC